MPWFMVIRENRKDGSVDVPKRSVLDPGKPSVRPAEENIGRVLQASSQSEKKKENKLFYGRQEFQRISLTEARE